MHNADSQARVLVTRIKTDASAFIRYALAVAVTLSTSGFLFGATGEWKTLADVPSWMVDNRDTLLLRSDGSWTVTTDGGQPPYGIYVNGNLSTSGSNWAGFAKQSEFPLPGTVGTITDWDLQVISGSAPRCPVVGSGSNPNSTVSAIAFTTTTVSIFARDDGGCGSQGRVTFTLRIRYRQLLRNLNVKIEPSAARVAGAAWMIDGTTTWNASDTSVSIGPGSYRIHFRDLTSWATPVPITLDVVADDTTHTVTYKAEGDLVLGVAPTTQTIFAGSTATFLLTVSSVNGFTGTVSLSATGTPLGTTTMSPGNKFTFASGESRAITVAMIASAAATPGTYTITLQADAATFRRQTAATLIVQSATSAGSVLNFPRVFSVDELRTTGIAVTNPGTVSAAATFRLYAADGLELAATTQFINPGGQLARLGSELFGSPATGGWVQITSPATGLCGFWVSGDFRTATDGAAAATSTVDQVLPLVVGQTEFDFANPSTASTTATIRPFSPTGSELVSPVTRTLPALGALRATAQELFGSIAGSIGYVRITSIGGVAATSVIKGYLVPLDTAAINGIPLDGVSSNLLFPHVISGPLGASNYSTILGVMNPTSSQQTISITFTSDNGVGPITVQRLLPPLASLRENTRDMFGFPTSFVQGWIRVTGSGALAGFAVYAEPNAGGLAVVPNQPVPQSALVFAHIADLSPWATGLALLNATSTDTTVEVFAITPSGTLIGGPPKVASATIPLKAGTKSARLLSEIIPGTQTRSSDGGFVFVRTTNNVGIVGLELMFLRNGSVFANIPGFSLSGVYLPPN